MNRRILAGSALAAGATTLAAPNLASAQPKVRWRCPGSFPKSLDTLYGTQEHIARRVAEMTDGGFQIQVFGPGEVVPALQVLDAVGAGNVECGYTSGYYYLGKDPSLALVTCLPFGMNSRQHWAWLTHGGGRELYADVYRDQGVVALPANNTGAQMGGWFRRELKTPDDLKGLKFRIGGTGGMVLNKLGVIAQQLADRGGLRWVGAYLAVAGAVTLAGLAAAPASAAGD
jgi:TRAP-type mannitol/chloroaromatic compound transport system substrate-binding protein